MSRSHPARIPSVRPWLATGALFLLLPACAPRESRAAPPPVRPADTPASPAHPTREPVPQPIPPPDQQPTPPLPMPLTQSTPATPPATSPGDPPSTPAADPAGKPSDVHVTGFELGGTLEADGHVSDARTEFTSNETVHLAVLADGAPRSVRLGVIWIGPDAARVGVQDSDVTLDGPKAVPFALSSAVGLPAGAYKAEIRIDGWLATTAEFRVH